MASNETIAVNRGVLAAGAIALVAIGAGGAWLVSRRPVPPMPSTQPAAAPISPQAMAPSGDVAVTLTKEAAERAGIELATVTMSGDVGTLRIPGVVQANTYKTVSVTPITGGRLTRVAAELGQVVRQGQLLAEIYSPEVSEARTKYLSARAELGAHELEVQRTEKLVAIGAASTQELEHLHAEHATAIAMVGSDRARLSLFGLSDDEIQNMTPQTANGATLRVVAPANGVVTARAANVGVNVDPSMSLFTVADLSTVWIVGDLYERDFAAALIGAPATVSFAAYPDLQLTGKITYIDPQVRPETRTAQLRVEVPNAKGQLRLGMAAEVRLGGGRQAEALAVPRAALQTIGDRTVVYLIDPAEPTRFLERAVTASELGGDLEYVRVLSGLRAGDVVVSKGSFSLRAERERLGLGSAVATPPATVRPAQGAEAPPSGPSVQTARIQVAAQGYEPATVSFVSGVPARLTFIRTTDATCGTAVVIPSLNLRRDLPLNQPVDVDFTPTVGEIEFVCGMGMLKGTIVVR